MIDIAAPSSGDLKDGLKSYYVTKIEELQLIVTEKTQNLRRLQAQRNELNAKGKFGLIQLLDVSELIETNNKSSTTCAPISPYAP